ncbi:MAG: hypothetical protein DMG49_17465 [Acidobacteria bacterium]|nr:MAG: hypothetical protein DMG49_17465 [Acidobacteriota bacterium]
MQSAVAETDAPGQVEESASQTGEVLAHRAAEAGEVSIDELPDSGKQVLIQMKQKRPQKKATG